LEKELDDTIDKLEYGSIGINIWAANNYGKAIWGGNPGTGKPEDIQSGIDFVFNPYMLDHPVKAVGRTPIISDAHGIKEMGNAKLKIMSRLAKYSVTQSAFNLSKVISGALAGL